MPKYIRHVCYIALPCVIEESLDEIAQGNVGDDYIKSWDAKDEERINNIPKMNKKDNDIESALDYLNQDEELYDN